VLLRRQARAFPPESPVDCEHLSYNSQAVFFRLLRPELLQYLKRHNLSPPLSPDALTAWGQLDRDADAHNAAVRTATRVLLERVIPDFARWLVGLTPKQLESLRLSEECHRRGINMRHLAALRAAIVQRQKSQGTFILLGLGLSCL
jgi:hypothetical protein